MDSDNMIGYACGLLYHFRWFKYTLKPPYSKACGKFQLGTLGHILEPIVAIFEICNFMMIPEPFDCFPEKGASQKINVFLMKE